MSLATATTSTPSSLPARHGEARPPWFFSGSEPEVPSRSRHHHVPRGPPVDERDLCPVCNRALPPRSQDGSEEAREAHIRECIVSHGSRVRSPSSRSDSSGGGLLPVSSRPPSPLRMVTFTATEKDCLGQEGSAAECTICMEEYEVGQPLVRLECLCKFHRRCIVEWFERKEECPVHKVSY
ncbi:hypothetical protein ASPZODRAFT_57161 [Penicilliopsis zonata CBS 506.65]|uniref:RING-type E3 ubiquitin transferase n=1 Tax=Penicilliopsis zonata CBS 506.65 TaxID=1073090 RepID=A0A1L9SX27_9EURO|nr:hypothetical protein ASPZODRAFT_57161 [Penicilliopsis zonata CBS 506.65]OJJ51734.1 hypothetical protein ASPZODRAFT_57161 [Penicilliopsis zonata CBS 506.65]